MRVMSDFEKITGIFESMSCSNWRACSRANLRVHYNMLWANIRARYERIRKRIHKQILECAMKETEGMSWVSMISSHVRDTDRSMSDFENVPWASLRACSCSRPPRPVSVCLWPAADTRDKGQRAARVRMRGWRRRTSLWYVTGISTLSLFICLFV